MHHVTNTVKGALGMYTNRIYSRDMRRKGRWLQQSTMYAASLIGSSARVEGFNDHKLRQLLVCTVLQVLYPR